MSSASLWVAGAMLAQGVIALVLLWIMGMIRVPLVQSGRLRMDDIALSREPWPEHEKRVSNAFDNQFQLPVLFYVACGLSLFFGSIWVEALLASMFVASRVIHAAVFAWRNHIPSRFAAYTVGYGLLIVFWIDLLARLLFLMGPEGA